MPNNSAILDIESENQYRRTNITLIMKYHTFNASSRLYSFSRELAYMVIM